MDSIRWEIAIETVDFFSRIIVVHTNNPLGFIYVLSFYFVDDSLIRSLLLLPGFYKIDHTNMFVL